MRSQLLWPWMAALALLIACEEVDEEPCPACTDGDCTLQQAAACAGVHIGVAAGPTGDVDREQLIAAEFDALSTENELLWPAIHPEPDVWIVPPADEVLDFAEANGQLTTATHFVWDQVMEFGSPGWIGEIDDPDQLRAAMRDHLATLNDRYGGQIDRWIVVNEPLVYFQTGLNQNHFHQVLGPQYIDEAFAIAAEEAPGAERWINEIFLESDAERADAYVQLVAELVDRGVPVDGAGVQGHLFPGEPDFALLEDTLQRLADLELAVAITELDAPVENDSDAQLEVNAQRMARAVEACLAVQACDTITVWGLDDEQSWLNWMLGPGTAPLLFDGDLQPKPSYYAVRDALIAGRP